MRRLAARSLLLLAVAAAACATGRVAPLSEPGAAFGEDEEERELIREADAYEKELEAHGLFLADPRVQAYVDGVGAKLVPSGLPPGLRFRFHVVRDPTMNAFAMAQGAVQIHVGLIARLESEAQLAHVMAHEIDHVLHRDPLRFVRSLKNKTVAAKLASLALVPAALVIGPLASVGDLLLGLSYAAAVTGYGRELEREADLEALRRIADAGYPVEEAPRLFARLNEVEDPGALENFFYGSHPLNAEREAYTRELVATGQVRSLPGADARDTVFRRETQGLVLESIRLRLRARHYAYARQEVEGALASRGESAELFFLLGEASLLAAEDPDGASREAAFRKRETRTPELRASFEARRPEELAAAESAYRRALAVDARFALARRGLGEVAYLRGDRALARRELEAFLASGPKPAERRRAERVLEELGR